MTVEEAVKVFTERGFHAKLSGAEGRRKLFVASNWRQVRAPTRLDKADTTTNPADKLPSIVAPDIKPLEGLGSVYLYDDSASISETGNGWLFSAIYPYVEMLFTSLDDAVRTIQEWFKDIPELGDMSMSIDEAIQVLEQAELKADVTNNIIAGKFGPRGEIMRSLQSYAILRQGGVVIVILPNDTTYGRITIVTFALFQAVQKVLGFYCKED
jgi:hypothetical protein